MAHPDSSQEDPNKAFSDLVKSLPPLHPRPAISKFVKKLHILQEFHLPPTLPRMAALSLAEKGLIGQFTGLWPSPRTVQRWVEHNWSDKIPGKISIRFCGKGYYTFLFESKADKDLIFRNGPYFMDSRGLYLNKWTPDFDPELDIPYAVPVWVRLPHLPLHCWGDESVKAIGNAVGKYIDRSEPKDNMQACIPFKCKVCHEYGHFANRCTKITNIENEEHDGHWEPIKKNKSNPPSKPTPNSDIPGSSTQRPPSPSPLPSGLSQDPPILPPPTPFSSYPQKIPYPITPPLSHPNPYNIQ
eukprot:PITA_28296